MNWPRARTARATPSAIVVWWAARSDAQPWQLRLLGEDDWYRYDRLQRAEDRDRFLVGAALTRVVIGERLGCDPGDLVLTRRCEHCNRRHGRPRLDDTHSSAGQHGSAGQQGSEIPHGGELPAFSVSHSGDAVVVAVSAGRAVGVDIEPLTAHTPAAATVLRADELHAANLSNADLHPDRQHVDVLRSWVGKEAALKATGHGLAIPMTEVALPSGVGPASRPGYEFPAVHVTALPTPPGYLGAVAVLGTNAPRVLVRDGSARLANARGRAAEQDLHHASADLPFEATRARGASRFALTPTALIDADTDSRLCTLGCY